MVLDIVGNLCFDDIDSILDNDIENDVGGQFGMDVDDEVNGDGLGSLGDVDFEIDEDD